MSNDDLNISGVPEHIRTRASMLGTALAARELCVLECKFQDTGKPAYVLCRMHETEEEFQVQPIFVLHEEDPDLLVTPPEGIEPLINEKDIH